MTEATAHGRRPSGCSHDVAHPRGRRGGSTQYPHELSGGMRQRVMIAIALACGPTLLFADEPTTALDVTVQAQILDLLGEQRRERNMSLILVTHDLGVVAGHTDEIAVMYGGRIVEKAPTRDAVRQHEDAVHRGAAAEHPQARRPQPHPAAAPSPAARPTSSTRRRAAGSRRAARTPATAAATEEPPLIADADDPGHLYACWYPVGSPEYLRAPSRRVDVGTDADHAGRRRSVS